MIDFVGNKRWFFFASGILVVIAIISLIVSQIQISSPLRMGTDFTGGTSMILEFSPPVEQSKVREEMIDLGYEEARIQDAREGSFIVYTREITSDEARALADRLGTELGAQVEITDYYFVSPTVAARTARNAVIAVIIAAVAMLFYMVWACRRMPSPCRTT